MSAMNPVIDGWRPRSQPATVMRGDQRTLVVLYGDQDVATAPHLAELLAAESASRDVDVVVDLSAVSFLDSASLHALLDGADRVHARGRQLVIQGASPGIKRLLDILALDGIRLEST